VRKSAQQLPKPEPILRSRLILELADIPSLPLTEEQRREFINRALIQLRDFNYTRIQIIQLMWQTYSLIFQPDQLETACDLLAFDSASLNKNWHIQQIGQQTMVSIEPENLPILWIGKSQTYEQRVRTKLGKVDD